MGDEIQPGELIHYGVKGMKWGVRRDRTESTLSKAERKTARKNVQAFTKVSIDRKYANGNLFERPISEAQYKALSTKASVIRKGQTVQRVTTRKDEKYSGPVFVSTNKVDQNTYRALMPLVNSTFKYGGDKTYKSHYEVQFKALETLKSPSEKERVDAFTSLFDEPTIKMSNGKTLTGREYMARIGYKREVKTLNSQQLGLKFYNQFTEAQGEKSPINTAYFESLRKKGYNAVIDDNDRGNFTKAPLIVLNPNGSLKRMNVKPLSADEIITAQQNLKSP
jgi:hypothetical protein